MKKKTTITTETHEICVISGVSERELALFRDDGNVPSAVEKSYILSNELITHKTQAKGLHQLLRILKATYRQ